MYLPNTPKIQGGHLQAPEFAFDPDMGALLIEDLPKHLSAWEVYESLQDVTGLDSAREAKEVQ